MKYLSLFVGIYCSVCSLIGAAELVSPLDKPIFDDGVTLSYFQRHTERVFVTASISAAGGGSPEILMGPEEVASSAVPNTLSALYGLFPGLRGKVEELFPDDFYVMIQETLAEPGAKEKVRSFIGAYARDIK